MYQHRSSRGPSRRPGGRGAAPCSAGRMRGRSGRSRGGRASRVGLHGLVEAMAVDRRPGRRSAARRGPSSDTPSVPPAAGPRRHSSIACFRSPIRASAWARPAIRSPWPLNISSAFARPELGLGILAEQDEHLHLADPAGDERPVQLQGSRVVPQARSRTARGGGGRRPCGARLPRRGPRRPSASAGLVPSAHAVVELKSIEPCQVSPPFVRDLQRMISRTRERAVPQVTRPLRCRRPRSVRPPFQCGMNLRRSEPPATWLAGSDSGRPGRSMSSVRQLLRDQGAQGPFCR